MVDASQQFCFLDLPKDIRLMVYEFLHTKITLPPVDFTECYIDLNKPPECALVLKTIPGRAVLVTCRCINFEAGAILRPRLRGLGTQPIRLICNKTALGSYRIIDITQSIASCADIKDVRCLLSGETPTEDCALYATPVHSANGEEERCIEIAFLGTDVPMRSLH
jgi:hypothetical protein